MGKYKNDLASVDVELSGLYTVRYGGILTNQSLTAVLGDVVSDIGLSRTGVADLCKSEIQFDEVIALEPGSAWAVLVRDDQYERMARYSAALALRGVTQLAFPPALHHLGLAWAYRQQLLRAGAR